MDELVAGRRMGEGTGATLLYGNSSGGGLADSLNRVCEEGGAKIAT